MYKKHTIDMPRKICSLSSECVTCLLKHFFFCFFADLLLHRNDFERRFLFNLIQLFYTILDSIPEEGMYTPHKSLEAQVWLYWIFKELKALFNNVSTLKKSELHGPTCYQCLSYGVKMKPWKKLYFKTIIILYSKRLILKVFRELKGNLQCW